LPWVFFLCDGVSGQVTVELGRVGTRWVR
jgi:hypothetical protein